MFTVNSLWNSVIARWCLVETHILNPGFFFFPVKHRTFEIHRGKLQLYRLRPRRDLKVPVQFSTGHAIESTVRGKLTQYAMGSSSGGDSLSCKWMSPWILRTWQGYTLLLQRPRRSSFFNYYVSSIIRPSRLHHRFFIPFIDGGNLNPGYPVTLWMALCRNHAKLWYASPLFLIHFNYYVASIIRPCRLHCRFLIPFIDGGSAIISIFNTSQPCLARLGVSALALIWIPPY